MQNSDSKEIPAVIADCHLGKLAKYLRFMGIDTLYFPQIDDNDLIELANKEKRTILTRDRELYERKKAPCILLESVEIGKQLEEVIRTFNLVNHNIDFSRCIVCNEPLIKVDKEDIIDRLPPKVIKHFSYFEICRVCDRVYWHGDHYKRMKNFLGKVLESI